MRGPFERLKYDLRRLWECPLCKKRERTNGQVTSLFCRCSTADGGGAPTCMQLLEANGHRTVPAIVLNHPVENISRPEVADSASELSEHPVNTEPLLPSNALASDAASSNEAAE